MAEKSPKKRAAKTHSSENKIMDEKMPLWLAISLAVTFLFLLGSAVYAFGTTFQKTEPTVLTTSALMETIDIAELSTSEFTYNGIAQFYRKEGDAEPLCHIRYNATVKAGINLKDVQFDIDHENKIVSAHLPDIKITSNTIDNQTISFIPSGQTIPLNVALQICEEDARSEAAEAGALLSTAEENLRSTIQALLYPILIGNEYTLEWN